MVRGVTARGCRARGNQARDDVVREAYALSQVEEGGGRKEDVVVHEAGAVGYLHQQVGMVVVLEDVA